MALNKKIKNFVKLMAVFMASVIFIMVAVMVIFMTTIDHDKIKMEITKFISRSIGVKVKITGELKIMIFPTVAVRANNLVVSSGREARDDYFMKSSEVLFKVNILPLLIGQVTVDHVFIKNLDLQLSRDGQGGANWQWLTAIAKSRGAVAGSVQEKNIRAIKFLVRDFTIKNACVTYRDQRNNRRLVFSDVHLECHGVNFGEPFFVRGKFHLIDTASQLSSECKLNASIGLDLDGQMWKMENLHVFCKLKTGTMARQVVLKGQIGGISLAIQKEFLQLCDIDLNFAGIEIKGLGTIENNKGNWENRGELKITNDDAEEIMQFLGIEKYFRNPSLVRLRATVVADHRTLSLTSFDVNLGNGVLKGQASYGNERLNFSLELNQLDLAKTINVNAFQEHTTTTPQWGKNELQINPQWLNSKMQLHGILKVGTVKFAEVDIRDVVIPLIAGSGVLESSGGTFKLAGGHGRYDARLDLSNNLPKFQFKLSVRNIIMQHLLMAVANYDKLEGSLGFTLDLFARGNKIEELRGDIHGNGSISVDKGGYHGIDIPYEIRRVHASLRGKPHPARSNAPITRFDYLTMDFAIRKSMLASDNFKVNAPDYRISGSGSADLYNQMVDFTLSAQSNSDDSFLIPIKVGGTFRKPTIRLDAALMAQHIVSDTVQNVARKYIKKHDVVREVKSILKIANIFN